MPTEFPKVSSLSDIEIDQDKKALDSFLGPTEQDSQAEAEAEEPYFEDDYTSDYAVKEDNEFIEDRDLSSIYFDDAYDNDEMSKDCPSQDEESFPNVQETSLEFKESSGTVHEVNNDLEPDPRNLDSENNINESKITSDITDTSVPSS